MRKLLAAYKANPTDKNAQRLLAYTQKHPFASILLMPEDQAVIEDAIDQLDGTLTQRN